MSDPLIQKAARDIMVKRGVSAVYESVDGCTTIPDCLVRVDHETLLRPDGADYEIPTFGITIQALFEDVGIPMRGDEFDIDGSVYRVERIDSNDRVFVKVVVNEH